MSGRAAFIISIAFCVAALAGWQPAAAQGGLTQDFDDWQLVCEEIENALPCQIRHRIVDHSSQSQVLAFSIVYAPEAGTHAMQLVLPLDFLLEPGVTLEIGDYQVADMPVDYCDTAGCYVEAALEDEAIDAFRVGNTGYVYLTARDARRIGLPFSLEGFSKAEARLRGETLTRER